MIYSLQKMIIQKGNTPTSQESFRQSRLSWKVVGCFSNSSSLITGNPNLFFLLLHERAGHLKRSFSARGEIKWVPDIVNARASLWSRSCSVS